MSYKLDKPCTDEQRADFIVMYNHNQGLEIQESDIALYALEPNEQWNEQTKLPEINPNYDAEQLAQAKLLAKQASAANMGLIKDLTFQFTPAVRGKLLIQTPTMALRDVITNFKTYSEQSRGLPAGSFRYYDANGDQQPSPEMKNYDVDLLYYQMFYLYTLIDATYAQYEIQYNNAKTVDEVNAIVATIDYQKC